MADHAKCFIAVRWQTCFSWKHKIQSNIRLPTLKTKLNQLLQGFLFLFIFILLLLFTLQYCIGVAIHQHASAMGVHVFPILNPLPPPSPYHASGSSQCTSPKFLVSCIEPGLAIHFLYDIIHVLMPFSQIIPPSLSHRVQKTVLYICVSVGVSHAGLSLPSF